MKAWHAVKRYILTLPELSERTLSNTIQNYVLPFNAFFKFLCQLAEETFISPEPVDGFSKFKQRLETEKILQILYRADYYICLGKFYLQLEFFYHFGFQDKF